MSQKRRHQTLLRCILVATGLLSALLLSDAVESSIDAFLFAPCGSLFVQRVRRGEPYSKGKRKKPKSRLRMLAS